MTRIRKMTVAGQFYEKNAMKLELFLNDTIEELNTEAMPENSIARSLVVPHAGYIFSGKTAIHTFMTAAKTKYKNIFLIAPSHYVGFQGLALSNFDEYETPLGYIGVNKEITDHISGKNIRVFNDPHIHEHSLEVQLPIIKKIFPGTPIVPMVCGQINFSVSEDISKSLLPYWEKDNLWIISSDFTHYGRNFGYQPFDSNIKENLKKLDLGAADQILDLNPKAFNNYISKTDVTICGKYPILIMLNMAAHSSDHNDLKTKLIEYVTSGDLTGDFSHTVSYAGITIYSDTI